MDTYFTSEKIAELVTRHNWEMVRSGGDGKYKLRQRDQHHIATADFDAAEEVASKFCVTPNAILTGSRSESDR